MHVMVLPTWGLAGFRYEVVYEKNLKVYERTGEAN